MRTLFILFCWLTISYSGETIISLSNKLGETIDSEEREAYSLFPEVADFGSARILQEGEKYFVEFTTQNNLGQKTWRRRISQKALDATKEHVRLVELFEAEGRGSELQRAEALYDLGLRYSARGRYDLAPIFFKELGENYPRSPLADQAGQLYRTTLRLGESKGLWLPGALTNNDGRTELLIFSGYYGVWLGIATPSYFEADASQPYALGLLLGGPVSFLLTKSWTQNANISDSRAALITLGGHLGTWQGIGWAIVANNPGHVAVGIGELAGLAGIGIATAMTANNEFTTAQAGLMNYSMYWGAWFGLVTAQISGSNEVLRDMLLGTDVALAATTVLTNGLEMSKTRYRLINLSGVLGTMMGFGAAMLIEVDDAKTGFAITGAGSVAGLLLGAKWTANHRPNDRANLLNKSVRLSPRFAFSPHPAINRNIIPTFSLTASF